MSQFFALFFVLSSELILTTDMDQSRRDTFNEWSSAEDRIGPIPYLSNYEILKDLSRCFTSKDNPTGTSKSNIQFQRDLNAMIQGDQDYHASPTLARLCEMVAHIMHQLHGGHQRNLIHHQQGKGVEHSRRCIGQCRDFQFCGGEDLPGLQQTESHKGVLQTSIPSRLQQGGTLGRELV